MKKLWQIVLALVCVAVSSYSVAQTEKKGTEKKSENEVEIGQVFVTSVTHLQRVFLPLALAMPDDKFNFAPTNGEFKGVRTFAEQVKHVGATNYTFAAALLGEKPPAEVGEHGEGPASLKTKAEIMKYATDSFAYLLKAVEKMNEKNATVKIPSPFGGDTTRLAMATLIIGHVNDHYGQMVEYVRMNGIVPPASVR
jgi:uncharacterized damage-inducible protein DinB